MISDPRGLASPTAEAIGKAKRRLVPLVVAMYLIAYVDRSNLGFAALAMNRDLHLTPGAFGFAAGIFYVGYVLFEVPSNMLLRRFGARRWLCRIMVTWGLLSVATAFARGIVSLSVLRLLLGIAEAGLAPGLIYYLSVWFPKRELARVVSYYYLGMPLSAILAGPISGWILDHLRGVGGLTGWQWLFVIEGIPAVLFALAILKWLTNTPEEAQWMDPGQRLAFSEMMSDERKETEARGHSSLRRALLDPRVWLLGIAYCFTVMGHTGLGFWMPQIIKQFHVSNTAVGLLSMVPYGVGAAVMYLWSAHSDAAHERFWHFVIPSVLFSAGFVITAMAVTPVVSLVGMTLSVAAVLSCVPVFYTLPASFLTGGAGAGGFALVNAVGNIGGFFGPMIVGFLTRGSGASTDGLWALAGLVLVAPLLIALLCRGPGRKIRP